MTELVKNINSILHNKMFKIGEKKVVKLFAGH